ncbi:hypothetical protein [Desulfovibrio litoralis]|uniref:Uncharacterized protein n=1 Tax=Desulfovibrio litoralis DSM 11393 TaxID=1121455 RepID=A0A1M7SBA6_9BACT|nr:hypothetical protein [Desulfovibrio litoralis]SHN55827.1 hypothetical protein SAMN02745728_00723 [Desulfovibrio litoralis DSM 11393]
MNDKKVISLKDPYNKDKKDLIQSVDKILENEEGNCIHISRLYNILSHRNINSDATEYDAIARKLGLKYKFCCLGDSIDLRYRLKEFGFHIDDTSEPGRIIVSKPQK